MSTQPRGAGTRVDAQNPWPGLGAFDEAACGFFNGRDAESAELLRLVGQAPLTVLFGKSGLGKTSLAQAGLFPRLRPQNILPVYVRLDMRDRSAPLIQQAAAALQAEIGRLGVDAPAPAADESLWEHLHGRDVAWWSDKNQPLTPLFVFDQFEEAFTVGADNDKAIARLRLDLADLIENRIPEDLARRIEAGALAEHLDLRGQRYKVLLSFREDFLPDVEGWKGELPSLMRNRLRLLPMGADRAWQVVSGETPAGRTHGLVDDDTAREIVRFVAEVQTGGGPAGRGKTLHKPAGLPWEQLEIEPALLSLLCEGLNGKRKSRNQATINAALLNETGEAIIGDFYRRCVADVPEQTRRFIEDSLITEGGFRNSYPLQDALDQGFLTEALLRQLVDRRLLRIDHQLGADRVELIHDRLTDVVREHRDRERERLRRLRQRKRTVLLGSGFALFFLVAAALGVLYWRATEALQMAKDQARVAVAGEWLTKDPTLAALVLLEVERPNGILYAIERMTKALHEPLSSVLYTHDGPVFQAAFSPDGTRIVTASGDTARVWRADGSGAPVVLKGHEGLVFSAAFSPDGSRIVTASLDNTARVWRADGSGEPVMLKGHADRVASAEFSPDGSRIVTASYDGTARVWRADGRGEPVVLKGHEGYVNSAAFSPDGSRVVTASYDCTARVWRADGSGEPVVLEGHKGSVNSAAFSPDGTHIVTTASWDHTARIWRADGSGEPVVLEGHEDQVTSAAFSPDGSRIVTASEDGTSRVWQADGSGKPVMLKGHAGSVTDAVFSPDGSRVVTASEDGTARVWRADGSGEPVVLSGVSSAAFSPDGSRIVTVSADHTARVWRADGSGEPVVLKGHEGYVSSAAFSPDGSRIVTASGDNTARVWRADGSGEPVVLKGHESDVRSAAFSPDGSRIVTASEDKTARVWRADGSGDPVVLKGHEVEVRSAAFSPDGSRIVTAFEDNTVRVWRADGSGEPVVLKSPESKVWSSAAAFSPDGTRIVTVYGDNTARVWRADGSGDPLVLKGHESYVWSAAFSPDGTRVVTASSDGTARVWRADGSGEPVVLKGHGEELSSAAFSPDGTRIVTASRDNKTAWVWAISGERLQAAIRSATRQCLDPPFRQRYFGEPADAAMRKYQDCERSNGRSGTYPEIP